MPSNESEREHPEIIDGIPKNASPEVRRILERSYESITMMSGMVGPRESAIEKQVRPEHIPQFIELKEKEAQLAYKDNNSNRIYKIAAGIIGGGVIITVLVLFRDKPEMVEKILYAVGGLAAGAFGGYGYGKTKRE